MNILKYIFSFVACFFLLISTSQAESGKSKVDVQEIVFGHIENAHEWHLTNWNGHHITIPLPVIVKSEHLGWQIFWSSRFEENGGKYKNMYLANNGTNKGKVCEKDYLGKEIPLLDFSITKNVAQLFIVVITMLSIFLYCAHWYRNKKASDNAPKGFVGMMEWFIIMINEDIIKGSIGEKHYKKYSPYLLTVFFFIFISNIWGLVPIFPGGANLTGNIATTFFLALCTMIVVNCSGNKAYWKEIFWPEVPLWLKCPVPMMPVIEFFGVFTKPFALMVRLFANILAGHAIILSLVCIIFITWQISAIIGTSLTVVSVLMTVFMDFLEILVAFIQAYVFTLLSAVFIGLAHVEHESK